MFTQILLQKITGSITMMQIQLHHIRIYKKILILLSAFILFGSTCSSDCARAVEFGSVKYNDDIIDYSKVDKDATQKLADYYFNKALNSQDKDERKEYLQKASGEYFILTKVEPQNIYPLVQMARVYDYEKQNSYAKAYFFRALKIDKKNAATNYYFGEFYYTREEYIKALYFYNVAFENGFRENFNVLIKMATMYEKLGDLIRANQYYKKAFLIQPENTLIPDKIRELESIRYQNTGYYHKRRKK